MSYYIFQLKTITETKSKTTIISIIVILLDIVYMVLETLPQTCFDLTQFTITTHHRGNNLLKVIKRLLARIYFNPHNKYI